jgi:hypothetical protein
MANTALQRTITLPRFARPGCSPLNAKSLDGRHGTSSGGVCPLDRRDSCNSDTGGVDGVELLISSGAPSEKGRREQSSAAGCTGPPVPGRAHHASLVGNHGYLMPRPERRNRSHGGTLRRRVEDNGHWLVGCLSADAAQLRGAADGACAPPLNGRSLGRQPLPLWQSGAGRTVAPGAGTSRALGFRGLERRSSRCTRWQHGRTHQVHDEPLGGVRFVGRGRHSRGLLSIGWGIGGAGSNVVQHRSGHRGCHVCPPPVLGWIATARRRRWRPRIHALVSPSPSTGRSRPPRRLPGRIACNLRR